MEFLFLATWSLLLENSSGPYTAELQHLIVKLQVGNFIPFTYDFTKNSVGWNWIKGKWQWRKSLEFQCRFKMHNIQLNRGLFTRNYFDLKVKFWYKNLQKFMTEIFIVKIGWSPELMNDNFQIYWKPMLPANKSAIKARGSKRKHSIET